MKRVQKEIILSCMAYKEKDYYTAVCLTLSLASRGSSMQEAIDNLDKQVCDYVQEAISEPEYTYQLLNRPAPLSLWIKFWFIKLLSIWKGSNKDYRFYNGACAA